MHQGGFSRQAVCRGCFSVCPVSEDCWFLTRLSMVHTTVISSTIIVWTFVITIIGITRKWRQNFLSVLIDPLCGRSFTRWTYRSLVISFFKSALRGTKSVSIQLIYDYVYVKATNYRFISYLLLTASQRDHLLFDTGGLQLSMCLTMTLTDRWNNFVVMFNSKYYPASCPYCIYTIKLHVFDTGIINTLKVLQSHLTPMATL